MEKCGNARMNAIYNPKGRAPPVSSREGMERFIRDKYERRLWADPILLQSVHSVQGADSRPASSNSGSSGKSSRSAGTASDSMNVLMVQLYDMGFEDPAKNREALAAAQGNMEKAIERLVASRPLVSNGDAQLQRLYEMGFKNRDLNLKALGHSNGKLEEAINFIVANADLIQSDTSQSSVSTKPASTEDISKDLFSLSIGVPVIKPNPINDINTINPINNITNIEPINTIVKPKPTSPAQPKDPFADLFEVAKKVHVVSSSQSDRKVLPSDLAMFDTLKPHGSK